MLPTVTFTSFTPTTPTSVPAPARPPGGCVPGRDGVPASPLGHLMCGDYLTHAPQAVWRFANTTWPLLLVLVTALVAIRVGWLVLRRHMWRVSATQASWLEIVPPVTATPAATLALWQLLVTMLPTARRFTSRPARLVWEVHATPTGMCCGLWAPPGVNPTAVVRALHRAWPGVRAEHAAPPVLTPRWPTCAQALRPTRPEWLPLVEDAIPPTSRRRDYTPPEEDRLRAVFDGLAAAGRTGGGLLQVHVARAPRHRVAVLRRATVNPLRARRQQGGARMLILATAGLRAVLGGVLDFVTPGPSTTRHGPNPTDPIVTEQARQARTKHATAPHLLVAVHASATGPTTAAARAAAADITSGYSLLSAHWRRRRVWRPVAAARRRWVPESRMTLATVAETAALAGLPAEPSAYGLPAAASRRVTASRDVFTAGPAPGAAVSSSRPVRPRPATPRTPPTPNPAGHHDAGDDDPPIWSAP